MTITQSEILSLFNEGDIVKSGGNQAEFRITKILEDRVRIQPLHAPTSSRLRYDKLSLVITNFDSIDSSRIEASVGDLLNRYSLPDTQNESYLYGFAREYMRRTSIGPVAVEEERLVNQVNQSLQLSPNDRAERLRNAPKIPERQATSTYAFKRNPDVIAEALYRANGNCQGCQRPAPFLKKDGNPYLEVHHIKFLARGGEDTIDNAIALCPNCHREAHHA